MEEISKLLVEVLNKKFIRAVVSGPRTKEGIIKIKIRPLEMKGELCFQLESFTGTQAFHENLDAEGTREKLLEYMKDFRQMQIDTTEESCSVLVSKKGKATVKRKKRKTKVPEADRTHNRTKHYILEEGRPVPFLQDLGVMTEEGKIVRTKTDKFRQINRFLEFIEDILPELDKDRELTILDFGCGKSYLTFAMYYYLHEMQGYDIRIIGLDLKEDVIRHCGKLAEKYGYTKLKFLVGDIADYEGGHGGYAPCLRYGYRLRAGKGGRMEREGDSICSVLSARVERIDASGGLSGAGHGLRPPERAFRSACDRRSAGKVSGERGI